MNLKVILAVAIGIPISAVTIIGVAYAASDYPRNVPAAAAAEATLVCTPFQGLTQFSVQPLTSASSPEGTLTQYKVTALCKSQHTITGIIGLLEGESK